MWNYRELIRNLVLRDLRVRYKGSALGYLWTQLAPLLLMLVFLFVFMVLLPSGIALYPVFLIVGLLPWNFCSEAVGSGARSVIDNANLIKKVFFPREVLPFVSVLSSLLNYILSLPMMLLVMAVAQLLTRHHLNFSWTFAYLPVLLIIQTLFLTGVVLFLSALAVFFRDVVHLIGILIQFWFFLTPVVYSLDSIHISSTLARVIRWINPMASLIDFYREILYGNVVSEPLTPTPGLPALDSILRVLLTALIVLGFGYWFFQRRSGHFGEEI
jgi:lipopolysaccharide transport system permease protein